MSEYVPVTFVDLAGIIHPTTARRRTVSHVAIWLALVVVVNCPLPASMVLFPHELAWLIAFVVFFGVAPLKVVIAGWGIPSASSPSEGDAIAAADTPVMDELSASKTGFTQLEASSLAVGLPEGLMGNSEVGHLNIGAGRVVWQDVVRIDQAIKKDEFADNDVIKKTMETAANGNGRLHLCGLVSHGGVVGYPPLAVSDCVALRCVASRRQVADTTTALGHIARQANSSVCPAACGKKVQRVQGFCPLYWRRPRY